MNSEGRNVIMALLGCVLFYLAYTSYLEKKYGRPLDGSPPVGEAQSEGEAPTSEEANTSEASTPETKSNTETSVVKEDPIDRLPEDQLIFDHEKLYLKFNQDLSAITSIKVHGYKATRKNESGDVDLLTSPFVLQGTPDSARTRGRTGFHGERSDDTLKFWSQDGAWKISQTFVVKPNEYGIDVIVEYENTGSKSAELNAGLLVTNNTPMKKRSGGFMPGISMEQPSFVVGIDGARDYEHSMDYCEDEDEHGKPVLFGRNEPVDYIGFDDHYFVKLLQPPASKFSFFMERVKSPLGDGCPMALMINQPQGLVDPGAKVTIEYKAYFGPKEVAALTGFDKRLDSALNLGWFGVIAHPLLLAVKGLFKFCGNYGIAILIITIILKLLFYPLTKASAVSMNKMKKLQPQMNALKEKFKDDTRKQQQELMRFMSANKINPAKGCLPILPQIPVFIAFYNVLSHAIELRHAPFFGWIQDLSASDPYFITPILLGVGMFLQQKLNPNPGMDKSQEKILMMMPIVFSFMMLSLPAGMVLYMIANTAISIAQQHWLNKRLAAVA